MSRPVNLADLASAGYLPADVDAETGTVFLTRLAYSRFSEVWYGDSVAAAPPHTKIRIPFEEFIEQFADRPPNELLRVISHTSRCGSTLLANLLALRSTTMVLKEPNFVTVPAREIVLSADPDRAGVYASLLSALLNFVGHAASAAGRAPVVKITSWTVPVLVGGVHGGPDAVWLFLWREPEEVVASNRATHPSWGNRTEDGRAAARLTGISGIEPGTVEFYARTWHRIVEVFVSAVGLSHWRALRYRDFAEAKETALLSAEDWFGLSPAGGLPKDFHEESRSYSKNLRKEVFEPSRIHLRDPLPVSDADRVRAITGPALEVLRSADHHRLF